MQRKAWLCRLEQAGDAGLDVAVETDRVGPEPLELLRHELSISFFRRRIERLGLKAHPKPTGPNYGCPHAPLHQLQHAAASLTTNTERN